MPVCVPFVASAVVSKMWRESFCAPERIGVSFSSPSWCFAALAASV